MNSRISSAFIKSSCLKSYHFMTPIVPAFRSFSNNTFPTESSPKFNSRESQQYPQSSQSQRYSPSQPTPVSEPVPDSSDVSVSFPGELTKYDFSQDFSGVSSEGFSSQISDVLLAPLPPLDIEITPDGKIYLPEIKYRRILMKAFGPGGWALIPRGAHSINNKNISREYALYCHGRFVAQARGLQDYFGEDGLPMASEGCKSNALMRCCKDLGIASELWDPNFVRQYKEEHCLQVWATQGSNPARKRIWRRKDRKLEYPFQEIGDEASSGSGSQARYGSYTRRPYTSQSL